MISRITLSLIILFFYTNAYFAQKVNPQISSFFSSLMKDNTDLYKYVSEPELEKSQRLGITYEGIVNKFLISYDIDPGIKEKVRNGNYAYKLESKNLNNGFKLVSFKVDKAAYSKDYYFKGDKLVSPTYYHTRNWTNYSTKYFNFFISDSSRFNDYSISYLESYVDGIMDLLNFTRDERDLLENKKIIYILCKDNNEIKKVTGFETRGIYILAYDEVITTYNCHLHELSHLLMNYKLKNLPLCTLAFLQEGFAVATGGRGGIARSILLDAGHFLHNSGFVPFNSIITQREFYSENASVSYPLAGLYSYFLLQNYGIEFYLETYLNYSGTEDEVNNIPLDSILLPSMDDFNKFINDYKSRSGISFNYIEAPMRVVSERDAFRVLKNDSVYQFFVKSNINLSEEPPLKGYVSSKFEELFPGGSYNGEKYFITVDKREINIYNLYTNILIHSYSAGFSPEAEEVPFKNPFFYFYINKDVFDGDIENLKLSAY